MTTKKAATKNRPRRAAASGGKLKGYHAKRDFTQTAEPAGKVGQRAGHRFVIQKHDASRLHYDFRLEVEGTLKSWAVPKGIPFQKGEKHLAVEVEDHPLEYADFEGVIPKGQYGGGTVMVWDCGEYRSLGGAAAKDLAEGKLHFELHGTKLDGEWTLVRTRRGDGNEWLLLKSGEDVRPVSRKKDDESSASHRSMARIARDHDAEWTSKGRKKAAPPVSFIAPMKATLVSAPPPHGQWHYELKFDGYRALALKNGGDVQVLSRNEKDFSRRFPEIAEAVAAMPIGTAALDGEIVALDEEGRPSFQLLQALETGEERPPIVFYVFDLLHHEGEDLTALPLHERRARLAKLAQSFSEPLRHSAEIEGDPERLLQMVRERGLEGIIGKESDSIYEVGHRSRSWIKLKCVQEQELVIGGYTPPEGTRSHLGALLLGYHQRGKFLFAGKVGTGFTEATLKLLHGKLRRLSQKDCPFANLPEREAGRWHQNITPREMKLCHWVRPELVCQVRFVEWTREGKLRHAVFLGLREDKAADEVVRERPSALSRI